MNTLTRRNFLIAGAIGAAGALGLTGCGGTADQGSGSTEAAQEPEEQAARYAVGDTVETDLVRLTLNRAELAIALVNTLEIGTGFNIDNDYFCPKEYTAEEDADNPYVASKGSTLVFYELLVENLDRDYLELDGSSQDEPFVSVSYDGETYSTEDFEEKKYGWMVRDIEGEQDWSSDTVTNLLAGVAEKDLFRAYVEAPFEPDSLSDPFEIAFTLPTVDGDTESFTFAINQ